jgi:hypothetical protein
MCSVLTLPTGSASAKTVTCATAGLATGTHTIAATYTGDANNNGSSGSLSQTVGSAPIGASSF